MKLTFWNYAQIKKYYYVVNYMRVVIIGAGAGGLTLASNLRKNNEDMDIVVFTKSE